MTKEEIINRLIPNDALFNDIYIVEQVFDIIPNDHAHFGASIAYQDIQELRRDFLVQFHIHSQRQDFCIISPGIRKGGTKNEVG